MYSPLSSRRAACFHAVGTYRSALGLSGVQCVRLHRACREECQCRFCGKELPDWKQKMTPSNVTPCSTAVMAVVLNGQEHRITVAPGRAGRKQFEKEIRRLFSLSQEDELEFTFDCQAPGEGMCPPSGDVLEPSGVLLSAQAGLRGCRNLLAFMASN
jgi:hypothetical protein